MPNHNRLGQEKSPYLLQHKDNPVWWYAWGEDAFKAAKEQDKPIFLSIGYSTCYWCHVMEKDSFEIQEVADVLNQHYIAIKIDREERPDIDQIYMDAVIALTGHGGWPMSVFLTPDLKPFYGGTFFYRDQFIKILLRLAEIWIEQRQDILTSSEEMTVFLKRDENTSATGAQLPRNETIEKAFQQLERTFDTHHGGFGSAPKFPPTAQIEFLIKYSQKKGPAALNIALFTLEKMARGGIYDHLGGGFARYSVDEEWLVPHFEKMLYDNALLAHAYLEASQHAEGSQQEIFTDVARETLDYILREMTSPEGGFYSAQDAGEVGKEGEFYVWKFEEVRELANIFNISESGNFEHGMNVLSMPSEIDWKIRSYPEVAKSLRDLLKLRAQRPHPHLDDKILTSWNGLMIAAMSKAAVVLNQPKYLSAAIAAANFIKGRLFVDGKLLRRYRDNHAAIDATLEDYAYLIEGLLELYDASKDQNWLSFAQELQAVQDLAFWDVKNSGYIYSRAKDLIVTKKDFMDSATPSGNSVALSNLIRLASHAPNSDYFQKIEKLSAAILEAAQKYPAGFCKALRSLYILESGEAFSCGPDGCLIPKN